ncbi:MAG: phosphate ABC transporter, permease protein PstA, partial [Gemmatimonadetes bacterium]|nr:phosphate ABC transporter, permease protein PstA [Gemmatimonadota bacterium]
MSATAPAAAPSDGARAAIARRRLLDVLFQILALLILCLALAFLGALIVDVWRDGAAWLSWDFLTGFPSRRA